ncbi:MAG: hypothetical protein GF416_05545 [Candidatus Altiarchaeales archaeon]|nr:hypothetical protein [Candidatus Altiarchaeales archaeon]MBD3416582.1 hypothetical protein [Candidatus Altiarchaeales archaeon]
MDEGVSYLGLHQRIKQMFEEARMLSSLPSYGGPFVYGFTMRFDQRGHPVVDEFGNTSPHGVCGFMEPITDVIEKYDSVSVVFELPGVRKEDIDLRASVESVYISVDTPLRKYGKDVKLSCRVRPESASANYNNGVLEVSLARVEEGPAGRRVKIH